MVYHAIEHYAVACFFFAVMYRIEGTDYPKTKRQSNRLRKRKVPSPKSASAEEELDVKTKYRAKINDQRSKFERRIVDSNTRQVQWRARRIVDLNTRQGQRIHWRCRSSISPHYLTHTLASGTAVHESITNNAAAPWLGQENQNSKPVQSLQDGNMIDCKKYMINTLHLYLMRKKHCNLLQKMTAAVL